MGLISMLSLLGIDPVVLGVGADEANEGDLGGVMGQQPRDWATRGPVSYGVMQRFGFIPFLRSFARSSIEWASPWSRARIRKKLFDFTDGYSQYFPMCDDFIPTSPLTTSQAR